MRNLPFTVTVDQLIAQFVRKGKRADDSLDPRSLPDAREDDERGEQDSVEPGDSPTDAMDLVLSRDKGQDRQGAAYAQGDNPATASPGIIDRMHNYKSTQTPEILKPDGAGPFGGKYILPPPGLGEQAQAGQPFGVPPQPMPAPPPQAAPSTPPLGAPQQVGPPNAAMQSPAPLVSPGPASSAPVASKMAGLRSTVDRLVAQLQKAANGEAANGEAANGEAANGEAENPKVEPPRGLGSFGRFVGAATLSPLTKLPVRPYLANIQFGEQLRSMGREAELNAMAKHVGLEYPVASHGAYPLDNVGAGMYAGLFRDEHQVHLPAVAARGSAAHELGHAYIHERVPARHRNVALQALGTAAAVGSSLGSLAGAAGSLTGATIGSALMLPKLVNELAASHFGGRGLVRELQRRNPGAGLVSKAKAYLSPFRGVPTYAIGGSLAPFAAYGARRLLDRWLSPATTSKLTTDKADKEKIDKGPAHHNKHASLGERLVLAIHEKQAQIPGLGGVPVNPYAFSQGSYNLAGSMNPAGYMRPGVQGGPFSYGMYGYPGMSFGAAPAMSPDILHAHYDRAREYTDSLAGQINPQTGRPFSLPELSRMRNNLNATTQRSLHTMNAYGMAHPGAGMYGAPQMLGYPGAFGGSWPMAPMQGPLTGYGANSWMQGGTGAPNAENRRYLLQQHQREYESQLNRDIPDAEDLPAKIEAAREAMRAAARQTSTANFGADGELQYEPGERGGTDHSRPLQFGHNDLLFFSGEGSGPGGGSGAWKDYMGRRQALSDLYDKQRRVQQNRVKVNPEGTQSLAGSLANERQLYEAHTNAEFGAQRAQLQHTQNAFGGPPRQTGSPGLGGPGLGGPGLGSSGPVPKAREKLSAATGSHESEEKEPGIVLPRGAATGAYAGGALGALVGAVRGWRARHRSLGAIPGAVDALRGAVAGAIPGVVGGSLAGTAVGYATGSRDQRKEASVAQKLLKALGVAAAAGGVGATIGGVTGAMAAPQDYVIEGGLRGARTGLAGGLLAGAGYQAGGAVGGARSRRMAGHVLGLTGGGLVGSALADRSQGLPPWETGELPVMERFDQRVRRQAPEPDFSKAGESEEKEPGIVLPRGAATGAYAGGALGALVGAVRGWRARHRSLGAIPGAVDALRGAVAGAIPGVVGGSLAGTAVGYATGSRDQRVRRQAPEPDFSKAGESEEKEPGIVLPVAGGAATGAAAGSAVGALDGAIRGWRARRRGEETHPRPAWRGALRGAVAGAIPGAVGGYLFGRYRQQAAKEE